MFYPSFPSFISVLSLLLSLLLTSSDSLRSFTLSFNVLFMLGLPPHCFPSLWIFPLCPSLSLFTFTFWLNLFFLVLSPSLHLCCKRDTSRRPGTRSAYLIQSSNLLLLTLTFDPGRVEATSQSNYRACARVWGGELTPPPSHASALPWWSCHPIKKSWGGGGGSVPSGATRFGRWGSLVWTPPCGPGLKHSLFSLTSEAQRVKVNK